MVKKSSLSFYSVMFWRLVLLSFFSIFLFTSTTAAMDPADKRTLDSGIPYFNNRECSGGVSGPSDGGAITGVHFPAVADMTKLADSINAYIGGGWPKSPLADSGDKFVFYGKKYDVNPAISVMIAQHEYGFGTNRTDLVGSGGPGQYNFWAVTHNSNKATRFGAYTSIDQAMEEHFKLLGGPDYIGEPTSYNTVKQIMLKYAPPSENDTSQYIAIIIDGMKKVLNGAGVTGEISSTDAAQTCGPSISSGEGLGFVDAQGYAFPIAAAKKSDYSTFGALSQVPCSSKLGCHHPFTPRGSYAFDLGVKGYGTDGAEGAPVYAISDGKIVGIKYYRNGNKCNQIEFKSSLDGYVYWYGHLAQDMSVRLGQKFKAGQQMGIVGPSACADNTTPHLHIDRGYPKGTFGGMEDSRDEGIIELINKLYDELPN